MLDCDGITRELPKNISSRIIANQAKNKLQLINWKSNWRCKVGKNCVDCFHLLFLLWSSFASTARLVVIPLSAMTKATNEPMESDKKKEHTPDAEPNLIFVGTGSSTGVPRIGCVQKVCPIYSHQKPGHCAVCDDAVKPNSKNRRRNPSVLIQNGKHNILIDCGKTFRESMISIFFLRINLKDCILQHKILHIDAVVLTHNHADAFLGWEHFYCQ